MNGLVFGGLIALAVVALILLVVVLMAEQRSHPAASIKEAPASPARETTQAASEAPTAPTPAPKRTVPVTQPAFEQERMTPSFNHSQPLPDTDNLALIRIRGQLREISTELRLLHKQSAAFEQRLSALTEAANYVERMLAEQTSVEEAEESLS